ncbi:Hypothetical predicted protein [Podarcis lilfordi]|uniref:Uncharacterized protein n=1 Tax=Podarcis lilfordi TaxID=74358 RepID=A0AA35KX56_9SAUR|nr:Hypothetical predicted protein [Podarcis lilfordi]
MDRAGAGRRALRLPGRRLGSVPFLVRLAAGAIAEKHQPNPGESLVSAAARSVSWSALCRRGGGAAALILRKEKGGKTSKLELESFGCVWYTWQQNSKGKNH